MSVDHADGLLELAFRCDANGRTGLAERRQRFPLRMTSPLYLDPADPGMAFVYLQNPTGGLFAGDRLHMNVAAAQGARVHVTTQSATKIYRSEGQRASQVLDFEVGPAAYVEHVPDPLIPHAGARLSQLMTAEVAPTGALVAAETIAPGRVAHGESLAYDSLVLHTRARSGGRQLCVDRLVLEPGRRNPGLPGVMGDGSYLVTLLALAPGGDAAALARTLDEALAGNSGVVGAAGELPHRSGALARALAAGPIEARRALATAWRAARNALVGLPLPPIRK